MKRFLFIGMLVLLIIGYAIAGPAIADWPKKPILITIPWPPSNDSSTIVANVLAPVMSEDLGVPVKIINKAGGRGFAASYSTTASGRRFTIKRSQFWNVV